jgi:hypothetical protein
MEVTEWSQRISNFDNVRGVISYNKFLRDVLSNVQGKMCMVRFFFLVSCKFIQLSVRHRLLVNVFLAASFDSEFKPLSGHFSCLMDMHLRLAMIILI